MSGIDWWDLSMYGSPGVVTAPGDPVVPKHGDTEKRGDRVYCYIAKRDGNCTVSQWYWIEKRQPWWAPRGCRVDWFAYDEDGNKLEDVEVPRTAKEVREDEESLKKISESLVVVGGNPNAPAPQQGAGSSIVVAPGGGGSSLSGQAVGRGFWNIPDSWEDEEYVQSDPSGPRP